MTRTDKDTLTSEQIVTLVRDHLDGGRLDKETIVRFIRAQQDEIDCLKHEVDFLEGRLSG